MPFDWQKYFLEGLQKSGIVVEEERPKVDVKRIFEVSKNITESLTNDKKDESSKKNTSTSNRAAESEYIFDEDLYKTIRFKDDEDPNEILKFFETDDGSSPNDADNVIEDADSEEGAAQGIPPRSAPVVPDEVPGDSSRGIPSSSASTSSSVKSIDGEVSDGPSESNSGNASITSSIASVWQGFKKAAQAVALKVVESSKTNESDVREEPITENLQNEKGRTAPEINAVNFEEAILETKLNNRRTENDIGQVSLSRESSPSRDTNTTPPPLESKEQIDVNPNGLTPGRAYILNHLKFDDPEIKERTGSLADLESLINVLFKFQMTVEFISDGTLEEVKATMEKISNYDFRNVSCLMIVIMSHGFQGNIVAAKDGRYSLDFHVRNKVLQNKSLESKLKFIVTETCKGSVDPKFFEIEGSQPTTNPSEILQLCSCVESYVSYLHPTKGSPFIQSLCRHLRKHGLKEDISYIAKEVIADVKKRTFDTQIPMLHSNLTKEYTFGDYITKNDEEDHWNADSEGDSNSQD